MTARKLGPAFVVLGAIMTLGVVASPAGAFSVGQTCNGTFTAGATSTVTCSGQGTPSQAVWVTVYNTGTVLFAPVACPKADCGGVQIVRFPFYATSPGDSSFLALPAGDTLGLYTFANSGGEPASGNVAAYISGIYPQSSPPPLAAGQVCGGANFIPLQVSCIWTGQWGAVTQNSWVTFANTGPQPVGIGFNGLHGSQDNQKLAPGQIAYVGVGAGHSSSSAQLELIEQGNPSPTEENPDVPPNPPAQVTVQTVVPENYGGFSLAGGQSCTTADFIVNPVQCATSGQIGQGSSSTDQTVTLTNTAGGNYAKVSNDNGGGGLLDLPPGATGTTSFDKNAQLLLTCLSSGGASNCGAGSNATVKVDSVAASSNAATLASPTLGGQGGRLNASLRCGASRGRPCEGTITLRAKLHGKALARATFKLRPGGRVTIKLSPGSKPPRAGVLTITTRQASGRILVTDRRTVALGPAGALGKSVVHERMASRS
jgi:hypothetical protein